MDIKKQLGGQRLWITGASSGIGHALARQALAAGAMVAVSGRRLPPLESLRPPDNPNRLVPLVFDISDKQATLDAAAKLADTWGGVDGVIANAGDCLYFNPQDWCDDVIRRMMDINFFGLCNTAAAALPLLSHARGRGLLAVVSSAATLAPLPRGCAYGASKAAAGYFVESLRGHYPHIDFSVIYPGFVRTPLTDKNDFPMPTLMEVDDAANIILRGLAKRHSCIRFPRRLMMALRVINLLPARWQQRLLTRLNKPDTTVKQPINDD